MFFCNSQRSIIFLLFSFYLFLVGCDVKRSIPGGLYATPALCDLGVVIDTDEITGSFKIVNTSNKIVNINQVKLSCGCASIDLSKEEVPPNDFIEANLTATVKGKYGPNVFEAIILTDDKDAPVVQLQLSANIAVRKLDGTVELNLGLLEPRKRIDRTFSILPGKLNFVSISNLDFSSSLQQDDLLEISATPSAGHDNVELHVSGIAPSQNGEFSVGLSIRGDGSDWGETNVRLHGRVRPQISMPTAVVMGFIAPGESDSFAKNTVEFESLPSNDSIRKMTVINQIPDILSIQLENSSIPKLEFSLKHPGTVGTFSQKVEIEFLLSNGEKNRLSTNVVAKFL